MAIVVRASARAACSESSRSRRISSRAVSTHSPAGVTVPPPPAQWRTAAACSGVRRATASWTAASSARQAVEPQAGGAGGRRATMAETTQGRQVPASGSSGRARNFGGVGCQAPGLVGGVPAHT
ncbi:MAG: hypothetical protein H0V24_02330 [Chloroflexia bacterium]|nr:hypothetical protein [Chloroflexia bacterium]